MAKYLVLWEADESKIPVEPKVRRDAWLLAIEATKKDMKDGLVKEWGAFAGQPNGFIITEGTEEQILALTVKFMPFFRFKTILLASINQVEAAVKAIA
jgi:hypothetical protein